MQYNSCDELHTEQYLFTYLLTYYCHVAIISVSDLNIYSFELN